MMLSVRALFAPFFLLLCWQSGNAQEGRVTPTSLFTSAEQEAFLLKATIITGASLPLNPGKSWRASLDDGARKHAAVVETATSPDLSDRDYRFNIAAYELDKALQLGLVVPSVYRAVNGQPAAVTWWLDDLLMTEQQRRIKRIDPPDLDGWNERMQTVRVFDELIDNAYRTMSPDSFASSLWDNLLITRTWQIRLIDHTRAFGNSTRLQDPGSLMRCDRTLLARLRMPMSADTVGRLGNYLNAGQLEALEVRRALIVRHFDEQIGARGERAVLYDHPEP